MDQPKYRDLDAEWMMLIKEAIEIGIAKEEIRKFLKGEGKLPLVLEE
ncbi:anti-repressor SinI family protein [Bacillus sp. B15-48]|nr:anti-repressor SinI family protein [Bacillus sp. B15-48]MBM4764445.1 DNA-binding anti-repressor SinI [Bacillus sp. B15-48]